jgi:hypothetical protein
MNKRKKSCSKISLDAGNYLMIKKLLVITIIACYNIFFMNKIRLNLNSSETEVIPRFSHRENKCERLEEMN